ncbi:hypothetical protein FZW96_10785 [Bacillus sp. BGMRC 2118]|nr:hypothetical protein FZW96_10785 [Bacillus sp. BGMRC 2118]
MNHEQVAKKLEESLEIENDLMRNYLQIAEKIHDNENLKDRLQNFAEGNAKRTQQLKDELKTFKH